MPKLANPRRSDCKHCRKAALDLVDGACEPCYRAIVVKPLSDLKQAKMLALSDANARLTTALEKLNKLHAVNTTTVATHCSCGAVFVTTDELLKHFQVCGGDVEPTKRQAARKRVESSTDDLNDIESFG